MKHSLVTSSLLLPDTMMVSGQTADTADGGDAATMTSGASSLLLPDTMMVSAQPSGNIICFLAGRVAISGDNVYVTWSTNEGTVNSNFEVGFRASTDGGAIFSPINNLSNTNNADSIHIDMSAEGGNVIVYWWERNQTAMVPVARISTDNGQTFGDILRLTANPFGDVLRVPANGTETSQANVTGGNVTDLGEGENIISASPTGLKMMSLEGAFAQPRPH